MKGVGWVKGGMGVVGTEEVGGGGRGGGDEGVVVVVGGGGGGVAIWPNSSSQF